MILPCHGNAFPQFIDGFPSKKPVKLIYLCDPAWAVQKTIEPPVICQTPRSSCGIVIMHDDFHLTSVGSGFYTYRTGIRGLGDGLPGIDIDLCTLPSECITVTSLCNDFSNHMLQDCLFNSLFSKTKQNKTKQKINVPHNWPFVEANTA